MDKNYADVCFENAKAAKEKRQTWVDAGIYFTETPVHMINWTTQHIRKERLNQKKVQS